VDTVFLALRVVVSLAVVIAAIWFIQRRLGGGRRLKSKSKPISVVARQSVGAKASVAVVEFGGKRFLLGVTEHAVSVLDSAEVPIEETSTAEEFASVLSKTKPGNAAATPVDGLVAPTRLAGSILSAATWKQAFAAMRGER
jgi:flagellar protein FliO/FliZ